VNRSSDDIERVICVNPVSVRLRCRNDVLVEAIQRPMNLDGTYAADITLDLTTRAPCLR